MLARRCAPHRRARPGPGDRREARRPSPSCWRLPGVPLYLPEGRAALDAPVGGPHPPPRPRRRARRALPRDAADPRGELATRVAADLRHGDGQGRRGHHLLPLEPVRRAQRGRRGARPLRRLPRRVPRRGRRAGRRQARDDDHALHARHQAVEDVRARLAVLAEMPGSGPTRAPLVGAPPAAGTLAGAARVAEPRRRVADPGRPDGGLPHEGLEGGPARHQPRRGGAARSTRRSRPGPRRCSPTPSWSPSRASSWPGSARPAGRTRWARSCCSSRARGCPTSTRAPISSSTRWSTRTTAGRSTGRRGATCSPDSTRAGCPTSTRRGRRSSWSPRARCGCAATGRRSSPATARCPPMGPPPRTPWRSSGRRPWSRWRPGYRSGWPPRRVGRHGAPAARRGRRLARRRHRHRRRRGRPPARGAPGPLPGGAARPPGVMGRIGRWLTSRCGHRSATGYGYGSTASRTR